MKTTLVSLLLFITFSLNTFAQDLPSTLLEGHRGSVSSVAFSPDGQTLASGSDDATIRLWDLATGEDIGIFIGRRIYSVAFSPDGKTLASGSADQTIRLWDTETGALHHTLRGHTGDVLNVTFSPDGTTLASGGDYKDRTVRLWDAETGAHIRTFTGHRGPANSVAFSPDGTTLASGGWDDRVHLWDAGTGKLRQTLTGPTGQAVKSVAFSPDGTTLASGSWGYGWGGLRLRLWDTETGKLRHGKNIDFVVSVAFSPDGIILASGSDDDTVHLWDTETGELRQTLTGGGVSPARVAFSPDGSTIASVSYDTVRLWKLPSTRIRLTPTPVISPAIGEQFSIGVSIAEGENVGGYQVSLVFDPTALRYVESANGDYLPSGAFFVPPVVSWNKITLGATALVGVSNGNGTLARITFEVVDVKRSSIGLSEVILTDNDGAHLSHFPYSGKVELSLLSASAVISFTPASVLSPAIGEQITFNIEITGGQNVADYQLTYDFDASVLKYISKSRGNYLAGGVGNGDGTLETVWFEVLDVKASTVSVSGHLVAPNGLRYLPTFESAEVIVPLLGDVNRDGEVNDEDFMMVASSFGQPVPEEGNPADVNEDGVVDIADLAIVAGEMQGDAAAPTVLAQVKEVTLTRAQVQKWLSEARQLNLTDATAQRGILYLEQLLRALTPKESALLPNYPNPFNPETWIPYQLAEAADVTLTIYAVDGTVVRQLVLGHQPIGIYQGKSRAAYWDGRNALGESVASGVYFYTLSAGEFTATRKLLIRK